MCRGSDRWVANTGTVTNVNLTDFCQMEQIATLLEITLRGSGELPCYVLYQTKNKMDLQDVCG